MCPFGKVKVDITVILPPEIVNCCHGLIIGYLTGKVKNLVERGRI